MTSLPPVDADLKLLPQEVRVALEATAPYYFSLDARGRQAVRAEWGARRSQQLTEHLLAHAFGKTKAEIARINDTDDGLSDDEVSRFCLLIQHIEGVGQDYFSWNEWIGEVNTALSWETIGDYDRAQHASQEAAMVQDIPGYRAKPYRGSLGSEWVRYVESNEVRHTVLYDLPAFVSSELQSVFSAMLDELVPSTLVEDFNTGQVGSLEATEWFMEVDANGDEDIHRALEDSGQTTIADRVSTLREELHHEEHARTWNFTASDWHEKADLDTSYVVFSGPRAMDQVRCLNFLEDCGRLRADTTDLKALIANEAASLRAAMRKEHDALRQEKAAKGTLS